MRKLKNYKLTKLMVNDSKYDKAKADYAVTFIKSLKHTKVTWFGKPCDLINWKEQVVREVFGTIKPNDYIQFNSAYV